MADQKQSDAHHNSTNFVQIYVLSVSVTEAKELIVADASGSSDPYVKCEVFDSNNEELGSFLTEVIKKNLNPVWNKSHIFSFFDEPSVIRFEVWDKDEGVFNGRDDELGMCEIKLKELNLFPMNEDAQNQISQITNQYQIDSQWYHLVHIKGKKKGKPINNNKSQLKISIKAERLFPLNTERRLKNMTDNLNTVTNEKNILEQTLNSKINDLQTNVSKLEDSNALLRDEKSELDNKLDAKTQECDNLGKEVSKYKSDINELNETILNKTNELTTAHNKNEEFASNLNALQRKYDSLKQESDNNNANDESEMNSKDVRIHDLETRVEALNNELAIATSNANVAGAGQGKDDASERLLKSKTGKKNGENTQCCIVM